MRFEAFEEIQSSVNSSAIAELGGIVSLMAIRPDVV